MLPKLFRLVFLLCISSTSHALFFTNQADFLAADTGLDLFDFNDLCNTSATCTVPTFTGVSFNGPNIVIGNADNYVAPTDWLSDNSWDGYIDMIFYPAVNAVGFNVAADHYDTSVNGNAVAQLFSGTTLLDTQSIATNGLDVFDTFVGWNGLGQLDNLHVSVSSESDFVNIDNLYFGNVSVPEPATLALFGLGLLGLGFTRRKSA